VSNTFTLNLGVRYELPGNWIDSLQDLNKKIVDTAGGDARYALRPVPKRDTNNIQPGSASNWNPATGKDGMLAS